VSDGPEWLAPRTLDEAIALRADHGSRAVPGDYLGVCLTDPDGGGYLAHSLAALAYSLAARIVRAARQPPAIGHQMQNQGPTWVSAPPLIDRSCASRTANTGANSAKPANTLTRPRPLMPPRTKWFTSTGRSAGQAYAK